MQPVSWHCPEVTVPAMVHLMVLGMQDTGGALMKTLKRMDGQGL
jgi:hypothetical protein